MNAQRCLRGFRTVPTLNLSEALRLLVLCVVAVCEIGQPGGWRTPTVPCARRACASPRHKDGPRPLLPTSTLARAAREAKNLHPSATMEPRSPRLRHASRGGRSPTQSLRVDRRRACVSPCKCLRYSYVPRRRLPSGVFSAFRSAPFVGSLRGARARWPRRADFSASDRVLLRLGTLGTGSSIWLTPRAS